MVPLIGAECASFHCYKGNLMNRLKLLGSAKNPDMSAISR